MTKYICPDCGDEIEYFSYESKVSEYGTTDFEDFRECNGSDTDDIVYSCPKCGFEFEDCCVDDILGSQLIKVEDSDDEETKEEFSVGDFVVIKSDLKSGESAEGTYISTEMTNFRGQKFKIESLSNNPRTGMKYSLEHNGWSWDASMFSKELNVEEQSYNNDDFEVAIINGTDLIIKNIADDTFIQLLSKDLEQIIFSVGTEVELFDDDKDCVNINGKQDKLLELLKKCH